MKIRVSLSFRLACLIAVGGFSADAAVPIAEYKFDEPGGVYATNTGSSSVTTPLEMLSNGAQNNNHGVGVADGGLDISTASGNYPGNAQHTTGGNVTPVDDNNLDSLVSFTLMGWMKRNAATVVGNQNVLLQKYNGSSTGFRLAGSESGPSQDYLRLFVDGSSVLSGNAYSNVNQWTFFAVTYDGSIAAKNVNFYIGRLSGNNSNAVLVSTDTLNEGTVADTSDFLTLGSLPGGTTRNFNGSLDVIRIFGSQTDNS